jgi:hypothetical protein
MPSTRPRALWIEDGARSELSHLSGPVLYDGRIELVLAEDLTTAVEYLLEEEFDAVVVDVRLPPGDDPHWKELHRRAGRDKVHAELGLQLLRWLLAKGPGEAEEGNLPSPPPWMSASRVAVFSVDCRQEILHLLDELGIEVVQQKRADLPDTILRELIDRLLESRRS